MKAKKRELLVMLTNTSIMFKLLKECINLDGKELLKPKKLFKDMILTEII
jgi:hypothetical protein